MRAVVSVLALAAAVLPSCSWASDCDEDADAACRNRGRRALDALEAYVTAPLRWDGKDWLYFAGAMTVIGVSHNFDGDVRRHFTRHSPDALSSSNSHELQDFAPAAAMLLGTWGYANLIDDQDGRKETDTMLESAALSVGAAYAFKYIASRERPDQTAAVNHWRAGGSSFPSLHTTLAFAIGTVLAESGSDDYRWTRRILGYGAAGFTTYERLNHNAHWLSDTIAGGVLGAATARFAMNRRTGSNHQATLDVAPLAGGMMLSFSVHLP